MVLTETEVVNSLIKGYATTKQNPLNAFVQAGY